MYWNEKKSIVLSRILVGIFACAIVLLDLGCLVLCMSTAYFPAFAYGKKLAFSICCWMCSGFGFCLLVRMNRLLVNLQKEAVFIPENVKHLRSVSYCCFAAGGLCLLFALSVHLLALAALAAGFVGLIVRIVKNVFENAIAMKDELDYTV